MSIMSITYLPSPPADYQYRTMAEQATDRALELFDRGDRYEINGQKGHALGCDYKALRSLERSFQLRHMLDFRVPPLPWKLGKYAA